MGILTSEDHEALGKVLSVDTSTVIVDVNNLERLKQLQVNRLVFLHSSKPGQHLIGMVQKITRSSKASLEINGSDNEEDETISELNLVKVTLIGTLIDKYEDKENIFRRTLETVPEINAYCFALEGEKLTAFMQVISEVSSEGKRFSLGHYTLDEKAEAFLNGNKLFQRHAIIVGSTGSGKSWTTASCLEQISELPNANAIIFDLHGEYKPLKSDKIQYLRVAGPADLEKGTSLKEGILYLPYWLLSYESLISIFVDRSDQNAPNQAMLMSRTVFEQKKVLLENSEQEDILKNFTIDSPVPFLLTEVTKKLKELNIEKVPGAGSNMIKGDYNGKLGRLIARLNNKINDRRLGFLFKPPEETMKIDWLASLVKILVAGKSQQADGVGGVKIIDLSEVPSDVLPLIVSLLANLVFSVQQWIPTKDRHPIAIFCDEAHNYIPQRYEKESSQDVSIKTFERIAKEGRKYGVGLVVISQRPSEVSRTVLSQCNNLISMRLTNAEDQNVVKRLLPDSLGGFGDVLPILDTGEAIIVGDASLLPSRVRVSPPQNKPDSGTVDFWDLWASGDINLSIKKAVHSWRIQRIT